MNHPKEEQFAEWAGAIQRSDRNAFDALFRMMYPPLVRFAYSYTKDKSSANDLVQDAFVIVWQKRTSIDPDQSFKAYLYKIVRNRTLNFLRNRSSEIAMPELVVKDEDFEWNQTDSKKQAEELSQKFSEWIEKLPDRQQEAFELSRYEGLNHKEIATVMEVSPKTVNNHIVAAIRQLRIFYEEYQENNPELR